MKRKVLAVFLAVCLSMGMAAVPMKSSAAPQPIAEEEVNEEEWTWETREDGTVSLTEYKGEATEVEIPLTLEGKSVTDIGSHAFSYSSVIKVTISDSVQSIGSYAFYDSYLEEVTISDSVQSIGSYAFAKSCLEEVTIPDSVQSISDNAFSRCSGLRSVTLPDNLTAISEGTFSGCLSLENIVLPKNLTSIGEEVFEGCSDLKQIEVAEGNETYASVEGVLYNKARTELIIYPIGNERKTYEIPDGVQKINEEAFSGVKNILRIVFPSSLLEIGAGAFMEVPLVDIKLPSGLKTVGRDAFRNCGFQEVTIPSGVSEIGVRAFDSAKIMAVNVEPENAAFVSEDGILYNKAKTTLLFYPRAKKVRFYAAPFGLTEIGEYAFCENLSLTKIFLPETVELIRQCAFDTSFLQEITIMNPRCVIEGMGNSSGITEKIKIRGFENSTAQEYAREVGNFFEAISEQPCRHNYIEQIITPATCEQRGNKAFICQNCGEWHTQEIPSPETVSFSKESLTYNGKAQKVSVTVKDNMGKEIPEQNYSVSFSNNKNVGEAEVTVSLEGDYRGSMKKTFRILPKGTSLSKVSAGRKAFTAKWKKQASQTTGYEIQYSTSSKFSGKAAKIAKVKKNKTVSQKVSKLKANKKYYVRIRTYKTVKINEKNTNIYSKWSKAKTVTTKK